MKAVSARDANQGFSELLNEVEHGEAVVITKRGRPVAVLSPYVAPNAEVERESAVARAVTLMRAGLPWGEQAWRLTRDEMHER